MCIKLVEGNEVLIIESMIIQCYCSDSYCKWCFHYRLGSIYVIVISRARGMYGIYCTEARGRMPEG